MRFRASDPLVRLRDVAEAKALPALWGGESVGLVWVITRGGGGLW